MNAPALSPRGSSSGGRGRGCALLGRGYQPRRSPKPCSEDCDGWAPFESDAHGLVIERCDECWHGVPGAPADEDYLHFSVCRMALAEVQVRAVLRWLKSREQEKVIARFAVKGGV